MSNQAYETEQEEILRPQYVQATEKDLQIGRKIYVKNINQTGVLQSVRLQKKEAEVLCGNIRVRSKLSDLYLIIEPKQPENVRKKAKNLNKNTHNNVMVNKSLQAKPMPSLEINVIGLTVYEAIPEVEAFIDSAVIANLEEVRVVHGVGTGKLRAGIHEFLRAHKNVAEFRLGRYGEGETGVTIVKIK